MQQRHSNGEERLRVGVGGGLTEIRHISYGLRTDWDITPVSVSIRESIDRLRLNV
jgi:hypothetical protein